MSFGFGLGAGLRALTAARMGMETAGNNVANANTPGYSRQRVDYISSLPFRLGSGMQIGTGVDIAGITRVVDAGLERRIRLQTAMVGAAQVDHARFDELEGLLGEPNGGLSNSLSSWFGGISALQTDPSDRALRGGLVQAGAELAQNFQLLSRRINELGGSTFNEVRGLARQANELSNAVAHLNQQIIAMESNGSTANDLRDQREEYVRQLSELVDVNAIERSTGSVDLLVGGHLLVAGSRATELSVGKGPGDRTQLLIANSGAQVQVRDGTIAALLQQEMSQLPGYADRIDQLARNMILEVNRQHTTGMPRSGPFRSLVSHYGAADGDGDGQRGDELLSQAGLPFDVRSGELYINVSNQQTGDLERTRLAVEPDAMTLNGLAAALNGIDHLSASVDPTGRLRIAADSGYGFDFSPRLDEQPDAFGSFGGDAPRIGSSFAGPFDLSGQTFPVSFQVNTGTATSPTTTTVTLDAADFQNVSVATTDELVAAINADLGGAATAANVGGRLVIRSEQAGSQSQLSLANVAPGSALGALGLSTATAFGQEHAVDVHVEGIYEGSSNTQLVFEPESDGEIGVTPDLRVRVLDGDGNLVTTIDVGSDYEPGTLIDLGNGVKVSFGSGSVSQTGGDVFALDALADSDTSDVLVALGLNSFFHGTGAGDIEVSEDLLANVDNLAAATSNASGDASNLGRLLAMREGEVDALDSNTFEDFWADVIGDVGFEAAGAQQALSAQDQLLAHLEAERDAVSGVNLDEEMLDMVRYQQSFEAAARFLSVVQELTTSLINLGR